MAENRRHNYSQVQLTGATEQIPFYKQQNFHQAGEFYRSLSEQGRHNLISNFSHDLGLVEDEVIREMISAFLFSADPAYGLGVARNVDVDIRRVTEIAEQLLKEQARIERMADASGL